MEIDGNGIDLARTFSCGQAFRWKQYDGMWFGCALGEAVCIEPRGSSLYLSCGEAQLPYWIRYLGLDRNYDELYHLLLADERTAPCMEYSKGIRVLRQEPYEALISFIISQNNNVKRIAGIIERLCAAYGQPKTHCGVDYYAFPTAEALSAAAKSDLERLGAGYRAQYIIDAAQASLCYDFDALRTLDFAEAKNTLMLFSGVGPKVADCVLLFGLGFDEAFPADVWINRAAKHLYPEEESKQACTLSARRFGSWAGAAQQYLFHYARLTGLGK